MKRLKLILLSLFVVGGQVVGATSCGPQIGNCEYYKCLGQELNCASDSMILKTAAPNCGAYEKDHSKFSLQAQTVLKRLKSCLQNQVEQAQSLRCEAAGNDFVQAHVKCYLSQGFCQLPIGDKLHIGRIGFAGLRHAAFRRAAIEILEECGDTDLLSTIDFKTVR